MNNGGWSGGRQTKVEAEVGKVALDEDKGWDLHSYIWEISLSMYTSYISGFSRIILSFQEFSSKKWLDLAIWCLNKLALTYLSAPQA